jgi:hypothetical protein
MVRSLEAAEREIVVAPRTLANLFRFLRKKPLKTR